MGSGEGEKKSAIINVRSGVEGLQHEAFNTCDVQSTF